MNQFDFYVVKASAGTVTALKRAGVDRAKIERRKDGFTRYGSRCFPRWSYETTLGFFELHQSEAANALAAEWKSKGLNTSVNYHASN